jgi:hypothetical protein
MPFLFFEGGIFFVQNARMIPTVLRIFAVHSSAMF